MVAAYLLTHEVEDLGGLVLCSGMDGADASGLDIKGHEGIGSRQRGVGIEGEKCGSFAELFKAPLTVFVTYDIVASIQRCGGIDSA